MTNSDVKRTKELLERLLQGLDTLERRVASFGAETEEEKEMVKTALFQIEKMKGELRDANSGIGGTRAAE